MVRYKYSPTALAEAAAGARSITEVMRLLGVRVSGGSHAHISRQLKRFGIDTSHFTVDHINGDFLDNRPRNLRLLCPNCHSQTATYAGQRRPALVAPEVVYDPEAVTPTGFPIGRRLPRRPEWPWTLVEYRMKGP
ncbi:HNH endonuclease [Micromonospora musae]|uniref:HNH endonuclease signature motif containing protein n=1 Tax=Micromonospora musae TaxID=1894970 RepID=UPI00341388ED